MSRKTVKISTSIDTFARYRRGRNYYIDKTGFLESFLAKDEGACLFTRPRRFGKTMFMSMLAEFFDVTRKSQELFAGLKIAANTDVCAQWMNRSPVIFLSLKTVEGLNCATALAELHFWMKNLYSQFLPLLDRGRLDAGERDMLDAFLHADVPGGPGDAVLQASLATLVRLLARQYERPVVLLIDEYDVPLAKARERHYEDEMRPFVQGFFASALQAGESLQFAVLTGCLPGFGESLGAALPGLRCFDVSGDSGAGDALGSSVGDMFGFTQDEVDQLLADAGFAEKRDEIREWYAGYRFGGQRAVYCPWSIMCFLEELQDIPARKPEAYWLGTSANELTTGFGKSIPATVQEGLVALLNGRTIAAQIRRKLAYGQAYESADNFWMLLLHTGYLTIADDRPHCHARSVPPGTTLLAIPNREVREVFEKEVRSWFENLVPMDDREAFFGMFWKGDAPGLEQQLGEGLERSAAVHDHPYPEAFFLALLHSLFGCRYPVAVETEAGAGRCVLVVTDDFHGRAAVLAVRCAGSLEQLEACVQDALQLADDPGAAASLRAGGYRRIVHWGMAFCKKSCRMGVRCLPCA